MGTWLGAVFHIPWHFLNILAQGSQTFLSHSGAPGSTQVDCYGLASCKVTLLSISLSFLMPDHNYTLGMSHVAILGKAQGQLF